jgi:hypothetical protein
MTMTLKVRTGLKAGRISLNHARTGLRVRAAVKGGRLAGNHSRRLFVA